MNEESFIPGQRWISDTEPGLGLGMAISHQGRQLRLEFRASSEQRVYAIDNAPLTRVRFAPGDRISSRDGICIQVSTLRDEAGLTYYTGFMDDGRETELAEVELDDALQFNRPQERLFSGQLDSPEWFDLRHATLAHRQRLEQSPLRGLGGGRTSLLAHQLYIAHEVGRRTLPRVLLADEVGLGKTIESCMILHQQLLTGRATRALLLVPPALINQWLVELRRRFNLKVSLFDDARYRAIQASAPEENPFLSEQLILCSTDLLLADPVRCEQAQQAGWDLLIIDEAHHLEWSPEHASDAYLLVESLARQTPGVLLLTATPEQLGSNGHFARLRLLDADRYHDLERFGQEQEGYRAIATLTQRLHRTEPLDHDMQALLIGTLGAEEAEPLLAAYLGGAAAERQQAGESMTGRLLDRHGTGRALFRNSRAGIQGFPQRHPNIYRLDPPGRYRATAGERANPAPLHLTPERLASGNDSLSWWRSDPRIPWLIELQRQLQGEKLLLICAHAETACDIEQALRTLEGVTAALFHEGMSILERDRAAAWFADPDEGTPLLICSEIGSEGRNFQFAHHLVLFDLPYDPDLLEQRIGRLDRIGQTRTIQIHIPYFASTAQAVMLRWYDEGLNAFRRTSAAAHAVFSSMRKQLDSCLQAMDEHTEAADELIAAATDLRRTLEARMREGRDLLLELNSCREPEAGRLQQRLEQADRNSNLPEYAQHLLDSLGVDSEEHSAGSLILRPGTEMVEQLPGLPPQGVTGTFQRSIALAHEEREFLTWEHPMITGAMELLVDRGMGNSSICAVQHSGLNSGSLLVELLYVVECPAPRSLQISRFLPPTVIRLLIDSSPAECSGDLSHDSLIASRVALDNAVARKLGRTLREPVQRQIQFGEMAAEKRMQQILENGKQTMEHHYDEELARLHALHQVNPGVSREEISALEHQARTASDHLRSTHLRLDAVQLVVSL